MKLPVTYKNLSSRKRKEVREQYVKEQGGKCLYCGWPLEEAPPKYITNKKIYWEFFPPNFLKHPVHLHHSHTTGLTEGAVHSYCNAVLWQYEGE